MKDFTITEDFPRSEIEFDLRFLDPSACYDYLFAIKWPNGLVTFKSCGTTRMGANFPITINRKEFAWHCLSRGASCARMGPQMALFVKSVKTTPTGSAPSIFTSVANATANTR